MDMRFGKFFADEFVPLIDGISSSSVRTHNEQGLRILRTRVCSQKNIVDRNIDRAAKLGNKGLIARAVRTLDSTVLP